MNLKDKIDFLQDKCDAYSIADMLQYIRENNIVDFNTRSKLHFIWDKVDDYGDNNHVLLVNLLYNICKNV